MLLAIDPGIRGCGVALFDGGYLIGAAYVKNSVDKGNGPTVCFFMAQEVFNWAIPDHEIYDGSYWDIVMEWPQIYTHSKGDNNDLLALAGVDAAITTRFMDRIDCSAQHYLPREWKGQLTKEVCHARIEKILTPKELAAIATKQKTYRHNTLDAVGIGLFHLGRFQKQRVIPQ